jgi:hypothetical protein
MAKVKITADRNKIKARIDRIDIRDLNILAYDLDNLYPQRVIDIINDSGTAKTCLRMFTRFVMGRGAKDVDFYKAVVNEKGLTVDKLIRKMAFSKGSFNGIALHVNYNGLGQKVDVTPINFEYCRLGINDNEFKIAVYDDWGKTKRKNFKKTDVEFINIYNPNSVLREVEAVGGFENYKGQILYWTPNGLEYPLADFDAVLEDMITEAQTKRFKANTSAKNFLASHILITGKEEVSLDENGNEIYEENGLAENLERFQGGDGSGTILWMQRESDEESIDLKKVEIQDYDGLYEYTENSSRDNIIKSFLIPPTLLVRTSGSLGTSKEISDATDFYNTITADDRLIIEEILKMVFTNFYFDICPTKDYSIIPLKVEKELDVTYAQYFTKNEFRKSLGYEALEDAKSDNSVLAVTLGVGGTQALTSIIADPVLTIEQKKGSMIVLFGLTEQQANTMLGI